MKLRAVARLSLKKLIRQVELKSEFNFESFTGFAVESAEKGEQGTVGFQFNVKDEHFDQELKTMIIHQFLDTLVYPEIMHRVHSGKLRPSYRPTRAHILLNTRSAKNRVLLDREANFLVNFTLKHDRDLEDNAVVESGEIKEITKIFPRENYMGDAAHIMLLKFNNRWIGCVDLTFDRLKIRQKMGQAQEFLASADDNMKNRRWSPFVVDVWRATELAVQSLLLFRFQGSFSRRQDHEETKKRFKAMCDRKDLPGSFWTHFDSVSQLYKPASYGQKKGDFPITAEKAQAFLGVAKDMLEYVHRVLDFVDQNRRPSGDKIMAF